jgi:hypothetical protein
MYVNNGPLLTSPIALKYFVSSTSTDLQPMPGRSRFRHANFALVVNTANLGRQCAGIAMLASLGWQLATIRHSGQLRFQITRGCSYTPLQRIRKEILCI